MPWLLCACTLKTTMPSMEKTTYNSCSLMSTANGQHNHHSKCSHKLNGNVVTPSSRESCSFNPSWYSLFVLSKLYTQPKKYKYDCHSQTVIALRGHNHCIGPYGLHSCIFSIRSGLVNHYNLARAPVHNNIIVNTVLSLQYRSTVARPCSHFFC